MVWFIVSLSGKEQKGQTVGIHEVNYNWCHSTFPMVRVFRQIYWHISLDHCLVLLLPMQKTGLSQEYRQSSRTHCQVFCKVQSTHQSVALIPDLESDRVWSCCHQQIWLQANLPRTSCKPCGLQSNFALECRKQRNMIESGEPILSGKPVVISRWKTRHLG